MRSAAVFAEYILQFVAVSSQFESKKENRAERRRSKVKQRRLSKWWWGVLEKLAAVMVVGAILQFIRRLCVLLIGLLRLSYRKVCTSLMFD